MRYVSTRGAAPTLGFADALLAGLAPDGGLYVPERWPELGKGWLGTAREGYVQLAVEVMWPFMEGSWDRDELAELVADAYSVFASPEVAPLVELDDGFWLLDLTRGPTLAFKDVALQLLGRLLDAELNRRGQRVTIVGATSGDTGSAAIEALRDRTSVEVFILHPAGRVSEVQRRQMTTVDAPNVHNLAIDGTFDDCQDLVKAMFADEDFRSRRRLSAVNSINWARVMAQTVYYVAAAAHFDGAPVAFAVPTGNFGNVYAGYGATRMGLPTTQLVVASNRNDVLTRFFSTGSMELTPVLATISPSMDIVVSSNLERLLFELFDRDGAAVVALLEAFRREGRCTVARPALEGARTLFSAARVDEDETRAEIARWLDATGVLVDPHTAVGLAAARRVRRDPAVPMVALATADPAKFPDAVEERATGTRPQLPERLADLLSRPERFVGLPADLGAVEAHIDAATASV